MTCKFTKAVRKYINDAMRAKKFVGGGDRKEKTYEVKAGKFNYTIVISGQYYNDTISTFCFQLGGKRKGCVVTLHVSIPIKYNDERFNFLNQSSHIAKLVHLTYKEGCNLSGDLPREYGTRHMLKTAFSIVINVCPWVKAFKFDDMSQYECQNTVISLPYSSIAVYGKTYYEKYYNAFIMGTDLEADSHDNMLHMSYRRTVKYVRDLPISEEFDKFCLQLKINRTQSFLIQPLYESFYDHNKVNHNKKNSWHVF